MKTKLSLSKLLSYISICFFLGIKIYQKIVYYFDYWGFSYKFNYYNLLISIIILLIFGTLINKLYRNDLIDTFLTFWLFFIFTPITILYTCSYASYNLFIVHILFFITSLISFRIKRNLKLRFLLLKRLNLNRLNNKIFFVVISILFSLTLITIISNFTFEAFNISSIYDIRLEARENLTNKYFGYIKEVLARIIFPFIIIYGMIRKKKLYIIIGSVLILIIYGSTGALKSIIVVLPAIFFFSRMKNFNEITHQIIYISIFLMIIPFLENIIFTTYFTLDMPSRRLFFVPGLIEEKYIQEYSNNFLYYKNSFFKLFNDTPQIITKYIGGKYFNRSEMNANIGVVVDGYINFGYTGVILTSLIISSIIKFLNSMNLKTIFFGLIFVYYYYLNTSFLSTLLITHGLIALLIYTYIFKIDEQ